MGAGARPKDTRAELQSINPPVLGSKSACRNLDGKSGKVTLEKLRNEGGLDKMFRCADFEEAEKDVTSALPLYVEDAPYESRACDQPPL